MAGDASLTIQQDKLDEAKHMARNILSNNRILLALTTRKLANVASERLARRSEHNVAVLSFEDYRRSTLDK